MKSLTILGAKITPKFFKPINSFPSIRFSWASQVAQQISTLASIVYLKRGLRATISWQVLSPNWMFLFMRIAYKNTFASIRIAITDHVCTHFLRRKAYRALTTEKSRKLAMIFPFP